MAAEDTIAPSEWRSIPGFSDYEASSFGDIRRVRCSEKYHGHKHLPFQIAKILMPTGYEIVGVESDVTGKRCQRPVHRLVALAFLGDPPTPRHVVAHWDGDKRNNVLSNIRWATRSENESDKVRHGTAQRGHGNPRAKLSVDDVKDIRKRYVRRYGCLSELAREYSVSVSTIFSVVRGETWDFDKIGECYDL